MPASNGGIFMEKRRTNRKWMAMTLAAVVLAAGILVIFSRTGEDGGPAEATLADLLASRSERRETAPTAAVSGTSPYYSMMATPVCEYYDEERERFAEPMLIYVDQPLIASNPANDLLDHYDEDLLITVGGPMGLSHSPAKEYEGSRKSVSLALTEDFWARSDGAVLIDEDPENYGQAMYCTLLASYLNIPVIVTSDIDPSVESTLHDLGVKYTITAGDIEGYGKVMRFDSAEDAQNMTISFITDPLGFNRKPDYLTMANPMDGFETSSDIVDQQAYSGEVFHIYTPVPGAYAGLEEASEGVDFDYTVPDTVKNGIMYFELTFKPHEQDEIDGERIYCFIFYERENGWEEIYYIGTCAGVKDGGYETVNFEVPVLGATGNFRFHLEGRNTYEVGSGNLVTKKAVPFEMTMTLRSLSSPVYASMPMLSAIAPYQCAYHQGVLMAREEYAMHYSRIGNTSGAFEPSVHEESMEYVNRKAWEIKDDELDLISRMLGKEGLLLEDKERLVELADELYDDPVYVSIVADTNMIPHFYHGNGGHPTEGLGQPGDIIYSDVDMDRQNPTRDLGPGVVSQDVQDYELPIGRFAGYDAMDVSVLVARNLFYGEIIDNFVGHGMDPDTSWKDNGYVFLGSKMPVETMYGTYVRILSDYMTEAGFDVIGTTEERSDFKFAHQFQEGSNYIMGGVHGNFYWYVPQCHINTISGGSAYDVTNVLDMSMGPSTMFLVSCITGRIDGLAPENCLSMAYVHVGVASYVGATRSTLGWLDPGLEFDMRPFEPEGAVLMSEMYTENLLDDMDAGLALRDAKNSYLPTDLEGGSIKDEAFIMVQHYVLYGDPAFNPYEP